MRMTGQANLVFVSEQRTVNPDLTESVEFYYEGSEEPVRSLYLTSPRSDRTVSFSKSNGYARLLIRTQTNPSQQVDGFESTTLIPNQIQKSIFEPPGPNNISDDDLRLIQEHIQNPQPVSPALSDPNAVELYQLALKGVRYRRIQQPVLRRTKLVSNRAQIALSYANVGAVVAVGNIVDDAQLWFDPIRFTLPGEISNRTGYSFGWYKQAPNYELVSANLARITQTYEYGLWSDFLYGLPV